MKNYIAFLLLALIYTSQLMAHGDDDHQESSPPTTTNQSMAMRISFEGEYLEAVIAMNDQEWEIYVDDANSNIPVDAQLSLDWNGESVSVHQEALGVYHAEPPLSLATRDKPIEGILVLTLITDTQAELLSANVAFAPNSDSAHHSHCGHWIMVGVLLLLAALAWWWFKNRRIGRQMRAHALVIPVLLSVASIGAFQSNKAIAHGDDEHSHENESPALNAALNQSPKRLADGQIYIPKPSQRLMDIRTQKLDITTHTLSWQLNAHVVMNPNGNGLVQATQNGRVVPAGKTLPNLGSKVKADQILAYLEPTLTQTEMSNTQASLAKASAQLQATESRLQRLEQIRDSVSQKEMESVRAELAALSAEKEALDASLHKKIPLRSPVDGSINDVRVLAGQLVDAGATVFELITPNALLIEAAAYNEQMVQSFDHAVFVRQGNEYPVQLLGVSRRLKDQAMPVQFKLTTDTTVLPLGAVGTVLINSKENQPGVLVPQSALLRADNGRQQVVIKTAPETFRMVSVEVMPQPNNNALITAGLQSSARVVIQGASLIQQVR